MASDLLAIIKQKKQLIATTQAELDEAMQELQAEIGRPVTIPKAPPVPRRRSARVAKKLDGRRRRRPESSVAWSEAVLVEEPRHELHIDEMLKRIEQKFHKRVKKTTLVGNLARKVKAGDTFERTAPNTFGLLAFRREKQLKFGA